MAQNGPHAHQGSGAASDDGHNAPPTTITFSLTSAGPYGNGGSSSSATGNMENMDAGAGMGKQKQNLIPDLNMEDHDDDSAGRSKDNPLSEAEVEVAAADAYADADKGKNAAAADDGELNVHIMLERERRKKMKDLFGALRDLMPHVPQRSDKVTIVGEAIEYIRTLEKEAAKLEMQKQARQAARGTEASSSFSLTAMPQTAQGMAALSGVPRGGGVLQPVPPAAPPAAPASPPIRFRTWSAPNVVLTVANDNAYISVCAARRRPNANTLTMVTSVLHNHGIDVVTAQVSSDSVRSLFLIFAHLSGTEGVNTSSEQVYQRAVSEIMLRLNSNS